MSSPSIMICPATCELCQHMMPSHSDSCPRNGVHPSKWILAYSGREFYSAITHLETNSNTVAWEEDDTCTVFHPWPCQFISTGQDNMIGVNEEDCYE